MEPVQLQILCYSVFAENFVRGYGIPSKFMVGVEQKGGEKTRGGGKCKKQEK